MDCGRGGWEGSMSIRSVKMEVKFPVGMDETLWVNHLPTGTGSPK